MEALATESGRLLLTQGVLGVCVLALSIVVVILWRELSKCSGERIADAKAIIEEQTRCITNSSQHIAMSSSAVAGMNASNEQRMRLLEALAVEVRGLREDIRDLERRG